MLKKVPIGNKGINATYIMQFDHGQRVFLDLKVVEKDIGIYFDSQLSLRDQVTKSKDRKQKSMLYI